MNKVQKAESPCHNETKDTMNTNPSQSEAGATGSEDMSFQLHSIPCNLSDLALMLEDDDGDIKFIISGLISEARTSSTTLVNIMQNEGRRVLDNKNTLMAIGNPAEVDVQNLKESLKALERGVVPALAAATHLGGQFIVAAEYGKEAKGHRQKAREQREQADKHRLTKWILENKIKDKESEIDSIRQRAKRMTDASVTLGAIVQHLLNAIETINKLIPRLQDLDKTLYNIKQHGDAFKIIQSAFGRNPEKFEGRALFSLNALKIQWKYIENFLEKARADPANNM